MLLLLLRNVASGLSALILRGVRSTTVSAILRASVISTAVRTTSIATPVRTSEVVG